MPRVLTLDKSLSVLEAVLSSRNGVGTRSLAHRLDLNVATVHNIARTFCERGYLRQDPETKSFAPGIRLMLLGRHPSFLRSLSLSASAIIDGVAEKLNESVLFAAIDHGHVLNLKYVPSRQALRVHEAEDMSDHSYCTAVGKILLASLTDTELDSYLHSTPLQRFTPKTICEPAKLSEELKGVLARGYAQTRDEFCEGLSAIAVAVRDPWGTIVAGIGASAPTVRLQKSEQFETTLRELQNAASAVEQQWSQSRLADVLKLNTGLKRLAEPEHRS
jgi:DNA-binding IclR family transcriptional regulator